MPRPAPGPYAAADNRTSTEPLWTLALAAAIRPAEPIRPTQVAGFFLGLIGCIVIFTPDNSGTLDPLGTLSYLLAAISYVYMARYLTPKDITPTAPPPPTALRQPSWSSR